MHILCDASTNFDFLSARHFRAARVLLYPSIAGDHPAEWAAAGRGRAFRNRCFRSMDSEVGHSHRDRNALPSKGMLVAVEILPLDGAPWLPRRGYDAT